jgi:uncharacterized protein
MRTPSDLPPRDSRTSRAGDRGRKVIIGVATVVAVLLVSARFLAGFYVDYVWHTSVGRGDVFWGVLGSQLFLFVLFALIFIAIAVVNLIIADRLAPVSFSANMHPVVERFHELFGQRMRLIRIGIAVMLGVLFALPATAQWQQWMLFRNSKSFGVNDAEFGQDIGFYIFRLPFITFALDWIYAALIFILLLSLLTHVLNGGVVFQPPRPKVRKATKAHMAVLLALLAVLKAADYWVTRFELTTERRGLVQGATYSVVNAQLPAVVLLALIALLVAALFLYSVRSGSWRLPLVASGLWVVVAILGGVIYPAAVQALVVKPNQKDREAVYIDRNIQATRQAMNIGSVAEETTSFGTLNSTRVEADSEPLTNVRYINPGAMVDRFRRDQGLRSGLSINDLDVDRYQLDGQQEQVVVAARELDLSTIGNKGWQGRHLISTHGCGMVMAPANRVTSSGRPDYREVELSRPELYFSEVLDGYAIVNTTVREDSCPGQTAAAPYEGNGGVALNSVFRRMAFALDFLDYNLIGSSAVDDNSRILWLRGIRDRVQKVAPFLSIDGDPYPVALDGRVLWVVDAYTTSSRYPYAQDANLEQLSAGSGLNVPFNYIRNSVKIVVDAYSGAMSFFVVDEQDPILQAWQSAFPNLFAPRATMPAGLADHLRYPEDLFRLQTDAYSKYRLEASDFFDRNGAWSVAQGPSVVPRSASSTDTTNTVAVTNSDFAQGNSSARFVPYYSMFRQPGATKASFQMLRPFVPFSPDDSRTELQAYMLASSDPETYGQLSAFVVQGTVDGPSTVAATIESESSISAQITLLDQGNSQVLYGDLQLVPLAEGLLYIRPMYVRSEAAPQATFQYVLVSYKGAAAFGTNLQVALAKIFPGFRTDVGDVLGQVTDDNGGTGTDPGTDPGTGTGTSTPAELLEQADELFRQADEALPDFAKYDELTKQARALVEQALEQLTAPAG